MDKKKRNKTKRIREGKVMETAFDTLYIMDSIVGIILKTIGICAVCIWIITTKGDRRNG